MRLVKINVELKVTATDIIGGNSRPDLLSLIKEIDASMQDWDFTLNLCEHFAKLKCEYDEEVAKEK